MADRNQGKKRGGMRKRGRSRLECDAYRHAERREHNKALKLVKHLRRFPADRIAFTALENLPVHCQRQAGGLADEFRSLLA